MQNLFSTPPRLQCKDTGHVRRVGFELEFAGLAIEDVVEVLTKYLGGDSKRENEFEWIVSSPDLGEFQVELDWQFGKELAADIEGKRHEDKSPGEDSAVNVLKTLAAELVPVEIVCPPIPADQIHKLHGLVVELRKAGALGTHHSVLYAFGVHINPELPDLIPSTIIRYLKAFCVAQAWLVKTQHIDLSRRLSPYIDLYGDDYVDLVMQYDDEVSVEKMIDDYLEHNPTRNRALDLTPLFCHLDETRLRQSLDDNRIKARPTFHYRLPNCSIEQENWNLHLSWNYWCVIEDLASDQQRMKSVTKDWRQHAPSLVEFEEPEYFQHFEEMYSSELG